MVRKGFEEDHQCREVTAQGSRSPAGYEAIEEEEGLEEPVRLMTMGFNKVSKLGAFCNMETAHRMVGLHQPIQTHMFEDFLWEAKLPVSHVVNCTCLRDPNKDHTYRVESEYYARSVLRKRDVLAAPLPDPQAPCVAKSCRQACRRAVLQVWQAPMCSGKLYPCARVSGELHRHGDEAFLRLVVEISTLPARYAPDRQAL